MPGVRHDETDVGCSFVGKAVPRHSDQLGLLSVVDFGDDRHPPVMVEGNAKNYPSVESTTASGCWPGT